MATSTIKKEICVKEFTLGSSGYVILGIPQNKIISVVPLGLDSSVYGITAIAGNAVIARVFYSNGTQYTAQGLKLNVFYIN